MEPTFNAPRTNPEQSPALPPISPEVTPEVYSQPGVERAPEAHEREVAPQQQGQSVDASQAIAAPVLPAPVADDVTQGDAALLTSVPDVAADDDLIEKEWVDKAKRIITETADDPYRREAAVSQLQREYLRKRYGKELGDSN